MNGFIKKTLIFIAVMAVVALTGWFGRKAYKKATEHRLIAEAAKYMEKQDYRNAGLCLQRALQINPVNVEINRLIADMLEDTGAPGALSWRIRAAQLQTNNVEYRFAWAQTALKANDLPSAIQALRGVDEKSRSTAQFHKLAGALAWNLHDVADAEKEYSEALRLEPTNQAVVLNLSTVRLVSTNKSVADAARLSLEKIPTNSPLHLTAVRYLATDAVTHKSFDRAIFYSQQVINDPKAVYPDKLTHLQILHQAGSSQFDAWQTALEKDATRSPYHAYALGQWMQLEETPAQALHWLQSLPLEMQTNQPVPMGITDCQIALKDWKGLLAIVEKQDWGELNFYRLSLESLAQRRLDQNREAETSWHRAFLLSSHRLDRLARLNQLTTAWEWTPERYEVLQNIVAEFPKEQWADEQLIALLYADGKTHALADLLDKMYSADPSNLRVKNNLATVLLLLKSDLEKANRLASESYNSSTNNPFFACTYAYSLFLQSRTGEAVKILDLLKAEYLQNPSIAAYYGVVESEAGHKNIAREPLKLAQTARLLPEEMALVRQAAARP
jgi:cytochrome c-type biogenesis protein CcmH/NrfG